MSLLLGTLVAGISFLAWRTHATPFTSGSPTVISQVARASFGSAWVGHVGFVVVQLATALILFTGANTPFTGFPFLASFIAEDSFLPRRLTRRGHRLVFSSGIMLLTVLALALLIGAGTNVDSLIPFYAIGVFTGFTMAGLGMAKHHRTHRGRGWRRRFAVNLTSGVVSAIVVLIFAVVKFTEGAWLVVVLFPLLWALLMRLNRQYTSEARALDLVTAVRKDQAEAPHYGRHTILVLVDRLDLAVLRALRYAGSLRPTDLRVVHVVLDTAVGDNLQRQWIDARPVRALPARTGRLPGPAARADDLRARLRRHGAGPGRGHGAAAAPHVPTAVAAPAARPHGRPDSAGRRPHPARGRDHRPVRHHPRPGRDRPSRGPAGRGDAHGGPDLAR